MALYAFHFRIRIRKKSWKNPSTIFMDSSIFEKDIRLGTSAEFFVEIVEGNLIL